MTPELARFLAVAAVVIVTPGQDTALTIRNTLSGSRRGGLATALGVAVGQAFWTVAASAGVTALLRASATAFGVLRLFGAGYLVLLGGRALREAWSPRTVFEAPATRNLGPVAAFGQGLLSNLGNPKMLAFFTSLLPQFVAPGHASFARLLGLGLLFSLMTLAWLGFYAFAIPRLGDVLRRSAIRRGMDAVLGATLTAFGLRLATEKK